MTPESESPRKQLYHPIAPSSLFFKVSSTFIIGLFCPLFSPSHQTKERQLLNAYLYPSSLPIRSFPRPELFHGNPDIALGLPCFIIKVPHISKLFCTSSVLGLRKLSSTTIGLFQWKIITKLWDFPFTLLKKMTAVGINRLFGEVKHPDTKGTEL